MNTYTKASDIQSLLAELIKKEDEKSAELKKKMEKLSAKITEVQNELPSSSPEVVKTDTINLKCNTQKLKDVYFRSQGNIDDLIGCVKIGYGNECPRSTNYGVAYSGADKRFI